MPKRVLLIPQNMRMKVTTRVMGMSRCLLDFVTEIGIISAVRPSMSRVLKMLDPRTLPMEMSELLAIAPVTLTTSSGQEVPNPTMVKPITNSLILSFLAMAEAPSTRKSAPKTIVSRPAASHNKSVSIIPIYKYFQRAGCGGTYPQAARL